MNQNHPFHLSSEEIASVTGGYNSPVEIITLAFNENGLPPGIPPDITLTIGECGDFPPDWWI